MVFFLSFLLIFSYFCLHSLVLSFFDQDFKGFSFSSPFSLMSLPLMVLIIIHTP